MYIISLTFQARLFELTNSTTSSSASNGSEAESGGSNSEYEDGPDTDNELEIEVVTDI